MTNIPAFRLTETSKSYAVYAHPLDRLKELFSTRPRHRLFTALHPLSLDIPQGSSLGIVGDNGAGKSTLMHLLAGTHTPTSGTIERNGRILGLLELGVGFHPEFSGRDNLLFQGDILGIDRGFIQERMQDILDFAEIGEFIDQPLRTYSTGMKVRLAFALIASLDPDTLIVDEALAVGDMHFQKKCIDRMTSFREAGKTIILCSHSLYQIESFCDEVIWLRNGHLEMSGSASVVLPAYERYQLTKTLPAVEHAAVPSGQPFIRRFELLSPRPLSMGQHMLMEWEIEAPIDTPHHYTLSLKMENGRGVHVTGSRLREEAPRKGSGVERAQFENIPLASGFFMLHLRLWDETGLVLMHERVLENIEVRKNDRELGFMRIPFASQWVPDAKS
jgi:lipopolysaccharide transport system ATP-binding protein